MLATCSMQKISLAMTTISCMCNIPGSAVRKLQHLIDQEHAAIAYTNSPLSCIQAAISQTNYLTDQKTLDVEQEAKDEELLDEIEQLFMAH